MRREHGAAITAKDERDATQERRMFEDVDRARQPAKQFEAGLLKEQQ